MSKLVEHLPGELEDEAHALTARVGEKADVSVITSLMLDAAERIRDLEDEIERLGAEDE